MWATHKESKSVVRVGVLSHVILVWLLGNRESRLTWGKWFHQQCLCGETHKHFGHWLLAEHSWLAVSSVWHRDSLANLTGTNVGASHLGPSQTCLLVSCGWLWFIPFFSIIKPIIKYIAFLNSVSHSNELLNLREWWKPPSLWPVCQKFRSREPWAFLAGGVWIWGGLAEGSAFHLWDVS